MNAEEKVFALEKEFRRKEKYKVLYGWYLWDNIIIQKKLKHVISGLIEEFGEITFCGVQDDISFFEKRFGKNHSLHYVVVSRQIFETTSQHYPIGEVETYVEKIKGVACVISSSGRRWFEMALFYKNIFCIDVYDELRRNGIQIQDKNWNGHTLFKQIKKASIKFLAKIPSTSKISIVQNMKTYYGFLDACYEGLEDIYFFNSIIEHDNNDIRKKYYMMRRIIAALSLREFDYMTYAIMEYEKQYSDFTYHPLISEIELILQEVKEKINKRTQEDIIIEWCDAVPFEDLHKWNGYRKYRDNGTEFTNVYSNVTYTHPVLKNILCEELYMDGKLYNNFQNGGGNKILPKNEKIRV